MSLPTQKLRPAVVEIDKDFGEGFDGQKNHPHNLSYGNNYSQVGTLGSLGIVVVVVVEGAVDKVVVVVVSVGSHIGLPCSLLLRTREVDKIRCHAHLCKAHNKLFVQLLKALSTLLFIELRVQLVEK